MDGCIILMKSGIRIMDFQSVLVIMRAEKNGGDVTESQKIRSMISNHVARACL